MRLADLPCGNPLETLLVHNSGNIDLARKISLRIFAAKNAAAAIMALTAPFMSEVPRP